ncbi:hypothetical protein [Jiella sp. M17.18]|uniref:hypothetical protein n=1 Tax=Jiella sp. M17.18 TaxID=3234247 RepID=UPI0034DFC7F6
MTVGGKLLRELPKTGLRDLLAEWARGGRLERLDTDLVDREEAAVESLPLRSDDPHVLALARVSNSRLLYTQDGNLIVDFKNRQIIDPRGKVIKVDTPERIVLALLARFGN